MQENIEQMVHLRNVGPSSLEQKLAQARASHEPKQEEKPAQELSWYSKAMDYLGIGLQTAGAIGMGIAYFSGAAFVPIAYGTVRAVGGLLTGGARLEKTWNYMREGNYGAAAGNFVADVIAYSLPGGALVKHYAVGEVFTDKEDAKATPLETQLLNEDLPGNLRHMPIVKDSKQKSIGYEVRKDWKNPLGHQPSVYSMRYQS